jgi:molybdate transport system substrate-binding protein
MSIQRIIAVTVGLVLPFFAAYAQAADLRLFSTTALKTSLDELGPQFEKATESKLVINIGPAAVLKGQIDKGAGFDVAILTAPLTDALVSDGKASAASRTPIAHAGLGVAIRKGSPKPDISTTAAFKAALLNAKSIGYTAQGASAPALQGVFQKLGIADELKPKIKLLDGPAGAAVAKGEVEIGITQISEILPYADDELAGPLPADVQVYTNFSASVAVDTKAADAAQALIKFLTAPAAAVVIKAKGMEPG